jgi:hypothetical protein
MIKTCGNLRRPTVTIVTGLGLSLGLGSILGCSLLESGRLSSAQTLAPEVRDVPVVVRGDSDELKKRILVLPFLDIDLNRTDKVVAVARKAVVDDLLRTEQFVIVRNEDFPQDLKGFLKDSKEYDLERISRIASSMGIAAVLEGKLLDVRAQRFGDEIGVFRKVKAAVNVSIQVRMFGAKAGREILTTVRQAKVEAETTRVAESDMSARALEEDPVLVTEGVRKAFRGSVPQIAKAIEKINWEGRVAMVAGEKVYINAGRLSGIQLGDILKVVDEGNEVFDPESGKFIGVAAGRMKGTVEIVSYFGTDGAVGIIHSGSGFKENDKVEVY